MATDSLKACPTGWHILIDAEWNSLTDYPTKNGYGYGAGYNGMDMAKSLAAASGCVTEDTPESTSNDKLSNNSPGFTALHWRPIWR